MSKDKVIIVPIHNQLQFLVKCIDSVKSKTDKYKVILIDDGSDRETKEYIEYQCLDKDVVRLRNDTAQGFSAACNKGIQYALDHFDFNCLCLLNSDAEVVTEGWFDRVEQCFVADETVGIAGVVSDNAMAQTIKNIPEYMKVIDTKPTVYTSFIHGFAYFISKKLIDKIGLLDGATFPHYGSEDDYSLKSIKNGFSNIIVGSVFIKHHNEASYTHAVRAKFIKTTLPTLQKRWSYKYVSDCVIHANKAGQYLNNI